MTEEGLKEVLAMGRVYRKEFYQRRIKEMQPKEVDDFTKSLATMAPNGILQKPDILRLLSDGRTDEEADCLFNYIVEKGGCLTGRSWGVRHPDPFPEIFSC